eukprot:gene3295-2277_t
MVELIVYCAGFTVVNGRFISCFGMDDELCGFGVILRTVLVVSLLEFWCGTLPVGCVIASLFAMDAVCKLVTWVPDGCVASTCYSFTLCGQYLVLFPLRVWILLIIVLSRHDSAVSRIFVYFMCNFLLRVFVSHVFAENCSRRIFFKVLVMLDLGFFSDAINVWMLCGQGVMNAAVFFYYRFCGLHVLFVSLVCFADSLDCVRFLWFVSARNNYYAVATGCLFVFLLLAFNLYMQLAIYDGWVALNLENCVVGCRHYLVVDDWNVVVIMPVGFYSGHLVLGFVVVAFILHAVWLLHFRFGFLHGLLVYVLFGVALLVIDLLWFANTTVLVFVTCYDVGCAVMGVGFFILYLFDGITVTLICVCFDSLFAGLGISSSSRLLACECMRGFEDFIICVVVNYVEFLRAFFIKANLLISFSIVGCMVVVYNDVITCAFYLLFIITDLRVLGYSGFLQYMKLMCDA